MAKLYCLASAKRISGICAVICLMLFASTGQAQTVDKVTTYKDADGWKLQVNGEDFYVKGVVWGYSPRGENYSYNLWGESEEFIKKVLDHEFGLMAKAGVTANRSFTIIPPKWVAYIYQEHGIMSVINPLMGRYGANIGGIWRPFTDYSDELTRETLKAEVLAVVEQYKDTPGMLMFALGNESNYGLSWSSFEIENLPVGEQNREKAKFLYSLFAEVIEAGKQIDPNHLFTIVNGDIQYLDLIVEYGSDWDLLGVNAYRGISFEDKDAGVSLWRDVKETLDLPIVFMEFGSDAFNARDFTEDQAAQASFLKAQWQEIYNKSYGKGAEGNALGGFVFEWRDEWWKYKQTENLDVQDRTASWANGGYTFDFVEGQNNMNEEWFGITRLGDINAEGIYEAEPRMAYDVLTEIWSMNPYSGTRSAVNAMINEVDMDLYSFKSDIRLLKSAKKEADKFSLAGGSFSGEFIVKGRDNAIQVNGEDGLEFTDGQMAFLDFAFQPTKRIKGDFSLNILANVADSDFEFRYGDRGKPITVEVLEDDVLGVTTRSDTSLNGRERIEIYDFQASYENENYDLLAFYHVPRYHWGYEGDFYGLLRETTDMEGQDIWNAKAPYGAEYIGKQSMDGLKVVFGPEIYWGANPKAMVKYEFGSGNIDYAFIHAEDIAQRSDSSSATEATTRQSRQTTLYAKTNLWAGSTLELGGIMASSEKIDDKYDRVEGSDIVVDEIAFEDTLGIKAKLAFDVFASSRAYVAINYAGLVADAGDPLIEFGTELPYSALGNKQEIEGGIQFNLGNYMIYPRFLYRENIVDANPVIDPVTTGTTLSPGIDPRNRDEDPFAVLDNREAASVEIYLTYDPTPATSFYAWNVDKIEDAGFAYNFGITATSYNTATDAELFFFEEGGSNASFGEGLVAEDVYLLKNKMIFNPSSDLKYIFNITAGKQQSTGKPGEKTVEFYGLDGKLIIDRKHIISADIRVDDFGPYDFQRQFNLTYPLQIELDYTRLLDQLRDEDRSSKIGVKTLYRTLDENSPDEEFEGGDNDYMFEIWTYFELNF